MMVGEDACHIMTLYYVIHYGGLSKLADLAVRQNYVPKKWKRSFVYDTIIDIIFLLKINFQMRNKPIIIRSFFFVVYRHDNDDVLVLINSYLPPFTLINYGTRASNNKSKSRREKKRNKTR